jgi:hypothetical protein
MSTISAISNQYQYPSPLDRLQNELTSEVQSGTISADDQNALSSALNDIGGSLKSSADAGSGPPAPGQIQSTISGLISSEVQNGKLTSDQADELKGVFAKAFGGVHGAHHGHHAHGGGPPPSGDASSTDDTSTDPLIAALTGTDSTGGSSSTDGTTDPLLAALDGTDSSNASSSSSSSGSSNDPSQLFNDFIKSLQQSLSQAGYGANGQNASISAAFVVNFQS